TEIADPARKLAGRGRVGHKADTDRLHLGTVPTALRRRTYPASTTPKRTREAPRQTFPSAGRGPGSAGARSPLRVGLRARALVARRLKPGYRRADGPHVTSGPSSGGSSE